MSTEKKKKETSGIMFNNYMNIVETVEFLSVSFKHNVVPLLIGHTGIGKTEVIEQTAKKLGIGIRVLHMAHMEPADWMGLPKEINEMTKFCQPSWLPHEGNPEDKKGGIIFLDEINRAHEDMRQSMYQFITSKCVHTYKLPDNWHIVAAANPFSYEVYDFDRALRNRFAWVRFKPDFTETVDYLENRYSKLNPLLMWVKTDKSMIEYGEDFKIEDMAFTPRFVEKSMQIFNEVKGRDRAFVRKCLATLMPVEKVQSFLTFLEEVDQVGFMDILKGGKKAEVKRLIDEQRVDILSAVTSYMSEYFIGIGTDGAGNYKDTEVKNLVEYLDSIPDEIGLSFIDGQKDLYKLLPKKCVCSQPEFMKVLKPKYQKYQAVVLDK